jgi:hypothetical protein
VLQAEDRVGAVLAAPSQIPFAVRLAAEAQSGDLKKIKDRVAQKVSGFSNASVKDDKLLESKEFVFAVTANEFFQRISAEEIRLFGKKNPRKTGEFLAWLCQNPEVMLQFNEIGPLLGRASTYFNEWEEIYQQRPESREGLGRRAALTVAHANACGQLYNHLQGPKVSALSRYDWFMKSSKDGVFLRDVKSLSHFDLRFVVGGLFSNEDLEWCQKRYREPSFRWKDAENIFRGYRIVSYRKINKEGVPLSQRFKFYGNKPQSIPGYAEYGGVCVALSRTGSAFCCAAGVPTFMVLQPNHLAFMWKSKSGHWNTGNDIRGWNFSREYKNELPWHGTPTLVFLYDTFHGDTEKSRESLLYTWLAKTARNSTTRRLEIYKKALQKSPYNYEALQAYVAKAFPSG